jgi:hypothetical protein
MDAELKAYLESMEERLKEYTDQRAEVIETRLLRAFRQFAHPVEARLRSNKAIMRSFDARLDALEDRTEALEGGSEENGIKK